MKDYKNKNDYSVIDLYDIPLFFKTSMLHLILLE